MSLRCPLCLRSLFSSFSIERLSTSLVHRASRDVFLPLSGQTGHALLYVRSGQVMLRRTLLSGSCNGRSGSGDARCGVEVYNDWCEGVYKGAQCGGV